MFRLSIPVIHVASITVAEAFYCEKLGFRKEFKNQAQPEQSDPCYMGLVRDAAYLHVSSFSGDSVAGAAINLIVDDVDRLHRELQQQGVEIAMEPTDQTWGNREMYVRDPDGNCLRFLQVS